MQGCLPDKGGTGNQIGKSVLSKGQQRKLFAQWKYIRGDTQFTHFSSILIFKEWGEFSDKSHREEVFIMSQEKVDRYKQEKAHRKETIAKQKKRKKRIRLCSYIVIAVLAAAAAFGIYRRFNPKPAEATETQTAETQAVETQTAETQAAETEAAESAVEPQQTEAETAAQETETTETTSESPETGDAGETAANTEAQSAEETAESTAETESAE